ncbi:MAG: c-type cytochrome [Oscillatoria sp. SIO1A7]|nr:c-type cytochrome [Oscillatoria sp. SIO1A7]
MRKIVTIIGIVLLVVILYLVSPLLVGNGQVKYYADIEDHYKYGSIGSEPTNGIPYWIWKAMPVVFADKLPGKGYESLGFLSEEGHDLPIGFSKRKVSGIDRVGLNCAVCHVGTVRDSDDSPAQIVLAMPSNNLYLRDYIKFISEAAVDPRFSAPEMMPYINEMGSHLNPLQKLIYRYIAIPRTRDALIRQGNLLSFLNEQPDWGPGRVDTFSPYKAIQFNFPMDKLEESELIGTADYPPIWHQKPREGLQLHWDGNNKSVDERNLSAALGAGVTPTTVDRKGIKRVADWLWDFPPPEYPYEIDNELAVTGKSLFESNCAKCHAFNGESVGTVSNIDEIGTDRHRLDSYTYELMSNQNTLFAGFPERFKSFRKTNGYANMPLDGVWLRAPYLHNGSVPTLRDLLESPEKRPAIFYRGNDVIDRDKLGFVSSEEEAHGKTFFKYDTSQPGNSNEGHLYGTDLSPDEKDALVEYMKKL